MGNTYTEDDFKQVLKNLFVEKKRVKDLQKQLEDKGIQKFQAKLADIHKLSSAEEYAKLKAAFLEKEQENGHLQKQLEKVRPALRKLVDDLKSAQSEIAQLKSEKAETPSTFKEDLEEAHLKIGQLEEEKQKEGAAFQRKIMQLEEELDSLRKKNLTLEECQKSFDLKLEALNKLLDEERSELARAKANEQKETQRNEVERTRLVEKLADSLSQVQRQTEIIKELREEVSEFQKKTEEYEQANRLNKIAEYQIAAMKEERVELQSKMAKLQQEQLQSSDFSTFASEYEAKLQAITKELEQKEAAKEEILERSYAKMRELSERYELANAEIRKAQQHLAKKVKETTILRDLAERQKGQMFELQSQCEKNKSELERMHHNLELQRAHEEKLQAMAKERAESAENITKEWQDKYLALQQDWQDKKAQLIELQKMRKTYDQMATTFSSLKNILGNSIETSTTDESQNPGD